MKKVIKLDKKLDEFIKKETKVRSNRLYVYRIASITLDKVVLEKHDVLLMNNVDKETVAELNDETKVGTVTQKVSGKIIELISQHVDSVAIGFEMKDGVITKIITERVENL